MSQIELATNWANHLADASAHELLNWAESQFGANLTLACSLGAEDMVLVDMLVHATSSPRIFVLDTGRLHEATYETMERARLKYGVEFEVYYPQTEPIQHLLRTKGPVSFYHSIENRKECCGLRKVEPLQRALRGRSAWITGLRRSQAVTRANLPKVEWDLDHQLYKLNPLADWTDAQVWEYVRVNGVPTNPLHAQGYPSIGCAPCTRAITPGEDIRAGRWWWESPEQKECGLHVRQRA